MGAVLSEIGSMLSSIDCSCREWAVYVFNDCHLKSSCLQREDGTTCCTFQVDTNPIEVVDQYSVK